MLDELEDSVRRFVLDICAIMYKYGYPEVSVGVIMRLMGIDDEACAPHDAELIQLDETFEKIIEQHQQTGEVSAVENINELPPAGTTLH